MQLIDFVWILTERKYILKIFFFFFLASPTAYGSSQARNGIQAAAETDATTTATPDP